jgi:spore maturation protein CgeB
MNVVLVAALSDEGRPENGPSYEHVQLLLPLERAAKKVIPFDFMAEMRDRGRAGMNQQLVALVEAARPNVVIVVPFTDQLDFETVDRLRTTAPTLGYFFDDAWRIEFTSTWARHLTWVTTSDVNGVRRLGERGVHNVVYSPFGCNLEVFRPLGLPFEHDVTFVGRYHPYRAWLFQLLRRHGIEVTVRGTGWPEGRATTDEMVAMFSRSRINLNLSNCVSWDFRYLSNVRRPLLETLRAWHGAVRAVRDPDVKTREMVKGRHFEINACGGFQLTFYVEGLERHYAIGDELAVYLSPEDLVEKIAYFLRHDTERAAIAAAGLMRTTRDHSMDVRLRDLVDVVSSP